MGQPESSLPVDGLVVDTGCTFINRVKEVMALKQIKYLSVDFFHAKCHKKDCICNPINQWKLKQRFLKTKLRISLE